jgi:hypothetical protein
MANLLGDEQQKYMAIMFFDNFAAVRPADCLPYEDKFLEIMHSEMNISAQAAGILVKLSIDEVCESSMLQRNKAFATEKLKPLCNWYLI